MSNPHLISRPRRNRKSAALRSLCAETTISPSDLIYPLFVHQHEKSEEISSMPGKFRHGLDGLFKEIENCLSLAVDSFVIFPVIDEGLKSNKAKEAYNQDGLYPTRIREIKEKFPKLNLVTDVALDPYSSDGHDGLVSDSGEILNDETLEVLVEQALCHARAGADVIAPSDMMDGRVAAIRAALDEEDFKNVSIMSYTAKYCSAFYGPFRDALDSAPKSGDKKTYQMDSSNIREALRELEHDEAEGADIVMVKPAGAYLDVIKTFSENTHLPIAAYQVSGEYAMIKHAAINGLIDEKAAAIESLIAIKRAGADMILTYFAPELCRWLSGVQDG